MQLWLSRQSEVSIREQLATQIILGILSGELAPDRKLPSTRELARRFHVHPNTVSAGYRQLERDSWLEFRKGSGVYVPAHKPSVADDGMALDQLIVDFFRSTRRQNFPLGTVRARMRQWLDLQPPDNFLLFEHDESLARILAAEMRAVLNFPVRIASAIMPGTQANTDGCVPVALATSAKATRAALPRNTDVITLKLRSVQQSLAKYLPPSNSVLVGIASGWPNFVKNARTMLIATGFSPESLVVRDTSRKGWQRGLKQVAAVVCDSLTAKESSGEFRVLPFPLLAESSLNDLKRYELLVCRPLEP
jgi:DNA-binding transcriptional regulator YhcF (GntR family)